jgi:hypothetical protein
MISDITNTIEEKRDFLLDNEKQEVEEKIIAAQVKKNDEITEEKKVFQEKSKLTKAELVSEFIKLQETQLKDGEQVEFPEHLVKRMTKNEIIKKIANFVNKKVGESFTKTTIPAANIDMDLMMATGIYNMNLCMIKILETLGHQFKHKTQNVNILEDLSHDIETRREAFILVFQQIYKSHKTEIDTYMSPLAQYVLLTGQCASTTVHRNISKKKEESSDTS